jgi:hypothetical protein
MSSRAAHEDEEGMALDVFRRASGLLPGLATRSQPDPPDFVIRDDARRTSVEMTRYHHDAGAGGSEGAKREALERRVMAAAQLHFETLKPDVHVSVLPVFREGALRRGNVPHVAERLAKLVTQNIPLEPEDAERLGIDRADWDMFDRAGLGDVLINLTVMRWRGMNQGQWQAPVGGYMNIDAASVERPLRAKEEDLPLYKATFDQSWLIIYAPPLHASSFFDFEVLRRGMFQSTFDRVVFLDALMGRFVLIAER